jgi:polysaccharide biosynthesis transport protein
MDEVTKGWTNGGANVVEKSVETRRPVPAVPRRSDFEEQFLPVRIGDRRPDQTGLSRSEAVRLDEVFSRLWRNKAILLAGAIAGVIAMVSVSSMSKPIYRARTSIRLEELNERFPNLPEMLAAQDTSPAETYLQNELKVMQSDSLASRVAMRIGIQPVRGSGGLLAKTPFAGVLKYIEPPTRPTDEDLRIAAVEKALTIRSSLKSQVVEVFFDSPDPALAARGANAVVSEYISMNREGRLEVSRDNTEWLTAQISDLKKKLDRGNEELQAFARSSGLLYGANQSLLSEEGARQVQEELSKARAARASRQSSYEAAISNSPDALPASADNGLLRELEGKLAAVRVELTQLRGMYTPAHYKVVEAEARQVQLESAIKVEHERIIARMSAEYDAARRLENSLTEAYNSHTRLLTDQTAAAFRYNVLKRDLDSTELLYNSLIQKAKEAGITSAMRATSVRVIDAATAPSKPHSPNLPLNGSIGFSGGLMLASGIVLLRKRDSYAQTQAADQREVSIRELGTIPFARKVQPRRWSSGLFAAEPQKGGVELVTWYEQPSVLTEAFRAAIASILFSPVFDRQRRIVLTITSVQPQEGKTTAVSNLGIALAETHGRVLLIDADLRRPRLHDIFGHCNDSGLSTLLTGTEPVATMDLQQLIRETNVPGLFALPSGPGAPSITPLLYSARMSAFLERAKKEFDYILVDTPPALLFSDARILARQSDGVIVVVHAGKVTRSDLNAACANFVEDGTRIVGTIVNHTTVRKRGYDNYRQKSA